MVIGLEILWNLNLGSPVVFYYENLTELFSNMYMYFKLSLVLKMPVCCIIVYARRKFRISTLVALIYFCIIDFFWSDLEQSYCDMQKIYLSWSWGLKSCENDT